MEIFSFDSLCEQYSKRIMTLRGICRAAEWPGHEVCLKPTGILMDPYLEDEIIEHLRGYWRVIPIDRKADIDLLVYIRDHHLFDRPFMDSIKEYSDLVAFYYRWGLKQRLLEPDDARESIWGGICLLEKLIGMIQAKNLFHVEEEHQKNLGHARVKGGKARSAHYDAVKEELIRLLRKKQAGEFKTKEQAANAVEEELWLFIEQLAQEIRAENMKLPTHQQTRTEPGLVKNNLIRQALDWSRKDDGVSLAFKRAVKSKA